MTHEDHHIIIAIANDDKGAFESLFKSHYQPLCYYALKLLGEFDLSEEIVQGIFVNFWQKRSTLKIQSSVKSYLFQSVRNACYNHFKHVQIKHQYEQHVSAHKDLADESDTLQVLELENKIADAVEKLPTERKRIFELSRFEGKKYGEIAGDLNISIKTVENQMGKALKFLREELADYLVVILVICTELLNNLINRWG